MKPRLFVRGAARLFGTLAFPAVWYFATALSIWFAFSAALGRAQESSQLHVWRDYSAAAGDSFFYAAGLWLVHGLYLLVRPTVRRSIDAEVRGLASGLAGLTTFLLQLPLRGVVTSGAVLLIVAIVSVILSTELIWRLVAFAAPPADRV